MNFKNTVIMEKEKKQSDGSMHIPREYFLEGMKDSVKKVRKMMADARERYGSRYNPKNDYEEFSRRFGMTDTEKILSEYELLLNKKSNEPAVIRRVLQQMGDNACMVAVCRYKQEESKKK